MCRLIMAACLAGGAAAALAGAPATSRPANAAQAKVTVVSAVGDAQKMDTTKEQPKWEPVRKGDVLGEGTLIRTGLRTEVVLEVADRGTVTIRRATKMGLDKVREQAATGEATVRLGLKYGTVGADLESGRGPSDVEVATPVATLSVRGCKGDTTHTGDAGTAFQSGAGSWTMGGPAPAPGLPGAAAPTLGFKSSSQQIAPGETGNSAGTPYIDQLAQKLDVRIVEAGPGLSPVEKKVYRSQNTGRAIINKSGPTYSGAGIPIKPAPSVPVVTIEEEKRNPGYP